MPNKPMKPIELLSPNQDIIDFFSKYMMVGVKNLNTTERKVFVDLMRLITMEKYVIDPSRINIQDMVNANKPGAIIRRQPE